MHKVSLEEKLRTQTSETWCKGHATPCYRRKTLKAKQKAVIRTTLQKIWNELPQKPVAKAVQNARAFAGVCEQD